MQLLLELTRAHKKNIFFLLKQSTSNIFFFLRLELDKSSSELYKNVTCCFEQILEAKYYKPATAEPLTSHLKNHPSKMNKT